MANLRSNKTLIGSGFQKTGKSHQTYKVIQDYIYPRDGSTPRKVLIFDTNQEYTPQSVIAKGFNFPIKNITVDNILQFNVHPKIEVCRILPYTNKGKMMNIAEKKAAAFHILSHFRGGLVVLDDINSYVLNVTQEEDFVSTIMNAGHRNVDIIINFQSINMVNPILIRNMHIVRMHYQTDSIDAKFKERWEIYTIALNLVKDKYLSGSSYYCLYVDNLLMKVMGDFTKADFVKACFKYVTQQNTKHLKQASYIVGKGEDKKVKAISGAIQGLMNYYGNPQ